ncbi:MAG: ribosomal RNA small subunit methyltransferase A [Bacteroidetes bacterium]|nr:ribosomal RNA small subunit methyltransferase A [Bacteroidota bacterium]
MVRPKKHLGQHFLRDENIARKTADIVDRTELKNWLEIGPGTGVLTQFLLTKDIDLEVAEIDTESVVYLKKHYPDLVIHEGDFLEMDTSNWPDELGVIGNFPYNISSQIVFKILEHTDRIPVFAGMFQLEVAQRLAANPGNKTYGILSVLTQAFYDVKVEFKIAPGAFFPPPKVQSAVITAIRHNRPLNADRTLFFDVVKTAFQQRRKMLSNALQKFNLDSGHPELKHFLKLRAENLGVEDFAKLTDWIRKNTG